MTPKTMKKLSRRACRILKAVSDTDERKRGTDAAERVARHLANVGADECTIVLDVSGKKYKITCEALPK